MNIQKENNLSVIESNDKKDVSIIKAKSKNDIFMIDEADIVDVTEFTIEEVQEESFETISRLVAKVNPNSDNDLFDELQKKDLLPEFKVLAGLKLIYEQTKHLVDKYEKVCEELAEIEQHLNAVTEELDYIKEERAKKLALKIKRQNRRRKSKRQPMTKEIYNKLIENITGKDYIATRSRIAFCLLIVTGVRLSELLPLKVKQLHTLIRYSWIEIDRLKKGRSNHKAFLTKEGENIIKDRIRDFELIFAVKDDDDYLFTPDGKNTILRREHMTRLVNKELQRVSYIFPDQPKLSSHSFRSGYINQLWRDTHDIEFVRQSIGHTKIDSTSSYIKSLSDSERQKITSQIKPAT